MKTKHLLTILVLTLYTLHCTPLMASDWVLNESKYYASDKTDHIKLEVFLCDLDGSNTYCDGGTVIATNGSKSYELVYLKYHDQASDGAASENVTAQLKMRNSKAWVTNATYGSKELNSSEQTFQVNKWASDHHYMTAEIDFYYPSELAGDTWKIYFNFKHSDGKWYNMTLRNSIYINNHLGLSDYNAAGYKVERTGIDKMTFTMPKLPDDIPSKVSSIRSRKATYDVRYTFYKQDGSSVEVNKTYEPSTTQDKKEVVTFPDGVGNPKRIDCSVSVEHGIKDPSNWFKRNVQSGAWANIFPIVPIPNAITTDFRQFEQKAVLTWTTPSGSNYMAVTPYIYRVETDENGTPKSGKSWSKRGNLSSTKGGSLSFTDDDVTVGTYFKYMAVNVPTDFINNGINESSLNSPSDDLLAKLGSSTSSVMNTAPSVSIYDLRQDTSMTAKVRLTWQYTRVPTTDATVNFKVLRKTSINGEWSEIGSVSGDAKPAAGAKLSFEDSDLPNSIVRYQYKIRLEMGSYRFESDAVTAGLLAGTSLKEFTATKGTHDGSVTLTWKAKQIGTDNSNYIISRRYINTTGEFMQIHSTNGADENYTYEDNTVKPGYYYEYKIEVYDGGLLQNTLYTVGFCQSRGTVSGRVQFGSGTAVQNVRLWLRPADIGEENTIRGASQYVHDASEGIAWGADATEMGKVFGSNKDYTVQFFVRPDEGLSEGAVLADIPGVGQLSLGQAAAGGYEVRHEYMAEPSPIDLSTLTNDYTVQDGDILTGTLNLRSKISIADGATIKLRDVGIIGVNSSSYKWAGLTCEGDATIVLENYNYICGFYEDYPGIYVPEGKTLTIIGTGSLTAEQNGYACGIGGGYNISCGNITIANTVTSVTAKKGNQATDCIGRGKSDSNCGTVTIGGIVYWDGTHYQNGGGDVIGRSTYTYTGKGSWESTYTPVDFATVPAVTSTGAILPAGTYSLLTLSKTGNQLSVQVDTAEVKTITVSAQDITAPFSLGGAVGITSAQAFKGNFVEVRVFDHVLTEAEKKQYFDRTLSGRESGLALYWPLDEGLERYAFDASYSNDLPNGRHATIGANIRPSTIVPVDAQLSRYGLTNAQGEYIIRGIPFKGSGSSFTLVPEKGVHEFNPRNRSLFISPSSLTANNIDFEDVSSFPMTGHVYYAGTNIPVEGMMFYVDGELQNSEGTFVTTDANGYYNLSVPIGEHYVEAKLSGHTMVAGGRYPTVGKFNFNDRVQHDFLDSTLVNFVGRVAGGTANDTLPVGFGASNNNIGVATITLKLNNESFSFNCQDDYITPATTDRYYYSDTATIRSHAWTGSKEPANAKYIYINTDSTTGEFSAKLPPLKYTIKSIVIGSNENIEFGSLPEVDLTSVQKVVKDSMKVVTAKGDKAVRYYSYNTKMVQTYMADPQVSLWQVNGAGAFGEKELKGYAISSADTMTIADIWTKDGEGNIIYTYGFPVFARQKEYKFGVFGYEAYTNYDSGKAVTDTIPLNGQVLTVANEMSNEQSVVARVIDPTLTDLKEGDIYNLKSNQVRLDEVGKNEITFTTGAPNVTAPYTRQFSIDFVRNKRTYTGPQLNGIVLGELTNGNNFVTQGPDHVDMVLRDPPGAKGKTTWKTGTSWTKIDYETNGAYWDETLSADLIWGAELKTAVGTGVAIISGSKATTTMVVGESGSFSWQWKDESTYVYTAAENISTSTGSKYVGANGDIFIGKSHNFIIGTCRKLGFHQEGDHIVLGLKEAVNIGDSIATDFMFTTREIKETMIPKLIETRNALLEYMDEASAKAFTNNTDKDIYLTWLTPDNPNYGTKDTYVWKQGTKGKSQDLVLHYNESVRLWKERLAENEQDKIEAFQGTEYFKENRSFDGGTAYTYSERRDTTKTSTYIGNHKVGFVYELKTQMSVNTAQTFGTNFNVKTSVGYTNSTVTGDSLDNTKSYVEFDYELNDGNPGTDFTVDIYRSPRGWSDIFLLRGGQSYNPYEGLEYAEYYEPESQHVISYGTQQMEQPIIRISTDGNVGAKTAMLTDVPAGQTGQFTLHATNGSTTNQTIPFGYDLKIMESTNTKGLEILMDGTPINDRTLWIPKGETVKKIITVQQTDQSVLDYDSVELYFYSMYQPLVINDHVTLDVHFKPSSSPVTLSVTNPVINTDPTTGKGKLSLKLSGFNRQFKNLKNIGIQYRFAGNTQWTDIHTWVTDKNDSTGTSYRTLPPTGDLRLTLDMSDNISYPEGEYEFRAFTTTPYGNDPVQVFSETTKVIKDMTLPRPLFTPAPANGILGIGEQLAVEFNEDIVPGYVGDKNIIITAKLNGRPINHEVSLRLLPFGQDVRTINPIFLNGNFSLEFWINLHDYGTILHQGAGSGNFALNTDSQGHMFVSVLSKTFSSTETLPKDKWIFVAMNYKAETMTFNMLAQYDETTTYLFSEEQVPMEDVAVVDYVEDNYLYLGPINANIHDLALYNIYRDVKTAGGDKYVSKDVYTYGLTNYWPMNEGHGHFASDTRRTHYFYVNDSWTISNVNYALRSDSTAGAQVDISLINTNHDESYAIEMWYQSSILNVDTLFETGDLRLRFDSLHNLVLDYGTKSKTLVTKYDFGDFASGWHHAALNVVRGQAASFYLDGQRTAVIAEADVPVIKGATLQLIKGGQFGNIDELRIWKATLSEDRLLSNMYNTIDTSDVYARGLVAYYPFEKDSTINGVKTKGATLQNMAPRSKTDNAGDVVAIKSTMMQTTPPLKNAPSETRITAVPVASERKVVINLSQAEVSARDIEGTTLNVTLAEIHDLHGNISNPIKWTAFVQQNTLKWLKDSVNITKKYGEDYTFDVDIENKSGQIEYYTIANMPEWLSLDGSLSADDVQPLKTKTLRFVVNPYVPVNDYDVTIGLEGNNEILEPLRIVMKVRGETPDWTVDPTLYDHQMSIVGQVYLGGILMENPESLVAAFIGSECRGVASPKQERGAAYVSLNIYGHDTSKNDAGKPISFRIWDASRGVAYTDAQIAVENKDTTLVFHDGVLVGNFDNPAIWTKSDKVEQLISVHEHWNWITFGVEPETQYCDILFKDYMGWGILLKDQTTFIESNGAQWKGGNNPLKPTVNAMYKMKITRTPATETANLQSQMSIRGRQLALYEMPVEIAPGWNWMPYTPLTTKRIEPALAGVNPKKGDIVKSQKAFAIYGNGNWEGELTALEPGHGYLYFSADTATKSFIYPDETYVPNGMLGAPLRTLHSQLSTLDYFTPVDKHNYQSNMTMTIRLLDGAAIVDTCEIAAFIGDECRGAVHADAEGLYYLVIAGEGAGQAMEIKTVLDGEVVTIDNTLTFTSDDHIGTPWEPYIIQLNPAEGIEEITDDKSQITNTRKIFRDGILYILRNGKTYTATGAEVK